MLKKLKVGVIGLGKQNQEEHIPAILNSDRTELVAVCDLNKKN